jgi:hypothetical protein
MKSSGVGSSPPCGWTFTITALLPPLSKNPRTPALMKSTPSPNTFSYCSNEPTRTGDCRGPFRVTPRKPVTPVSTASSEMNRSPADSTWTPGDL